MAENNKFITGTEMIPNTTSLLMAKPMEMHTFGYPWTKFKVPSTGSIIQVGSSVSTAFTPDDVVSSPMNL